MQSKYAGKCKDCGSEHAIGDEIDRNNNDNWCRNGRNCQGAMQLQGTVTPQAKIILDDQIKEALKVAEAFQDFCVKKDCVSALANIASVFNTHMMRFR